MSEPRRYNSPEAFKQALEARLRATGNMNRARQILVMERFYGRIHALMGDDVIVKGGMVLERRLDRARTTKDLDLRLKGDPEVLLTTLREAARQAFGDFLTFTVEPDPLHDTINGDGMVYEGRRYRVTAYMAGKIYGAPFGLDAGFGDAIWGEVDTIEGSETLDFCRAPRAHWRLYPRQTHLAEKLHAYTIPRERENTRVKDLPDMALLASTGNFDAVDLYQAFSSTFAFRGTHDLPSMVPEPPQSWSAPYARMAREDGLPWAEIEGLYSAVCAFVEPVLQGSEGVWDAGAWKWQRYH